MFIGMLGFKVEFDMLQDRFNRVISYLRISVTERCNFRCVYCMPAEGVSLAPRDHILTFEEIARVARVGVSLGLKKIRLTGGEPTVRRDLPNLVRMLREIPGIEEITMTTNGVLLEQLAAPLKEAGLNRVNISLDTLKPERAQELSRRNLFDSVLRGIDAAVVNELTPLKLNAVVMRSINADELPDLVNFAHSRGAEMRFIEYMPMGMARFDDRNKLITASEMLQILAPYFDFQQDTSTHINDPSRGFICSKTGARVGFITSMSQHFCDTCNRMRLTAEGGLRPCLHQEAEVDVRAVLRIGGNDNEIAQAFQQAAGLKWAGHQMTNTIPLYSSKEMVAIGG